MEYTVSKQLECICLNCGIYHYIEPLGASLEEEFPGSETRLLTNVFCSECGGDLAIVGKEKDGQQEEF
jgi:hypothetical protein